jgi:hypothetical protein
MTAYGEKCIYGTKVSKGIIFSFVLIIFGSGIAGVSETTHNNTNFFGIMFTMLNCISTTGYLVIFPKRSHQLAVYEIFNAK